MRKQLTTSRKAFAVLCFAGCAFAASLPSVNADDTASDDAACCEPMRRFGAYQPPEPVVLAPLGLPAFGGPYFGGPYWGGAPYWGGGPVWGGPYWYGGPWGGWPWGSFGGYYPSFYNPYG